MKILHINTLLFILMGASAFGQWSSAIIPGSGVQQVSVAGPQTLYAFDIVTGIYKSTDLGQSWSAIPIKYSNFDINRPYLFSFIPNGLEFINETTGFMFGQTIFPFYEVIYKTSDGGNTWFLTHSAVSGEINNIDFASPTVGYAVGALGRILKTSDGGNSWQQQSSNTSNVLYTVSFQNANDGIAGGDLVTLKTNNGGLTWVATPSTHVIKTASLVTTSTGFATTYSGLLLKTTNGGSTWAMANTTIKNESEFANQVKFFSSTLGILTTKEGTYKSVDGGNLWSMQTSLPRSPVVDFDFNNITGFILYGNFNGNATYLTGTGGDPTPQNEARPADLIQYSTNLCRGEYPVTVKVINEGQANLTSVVLNWSVDGVVQPSYNWTGSQSSADTTASIQIGQYNFNKSGKPYEVKVWTSLPNMQQDEYQKNDTIVATYSFNMLGGEYIVGGLNGDFSSLEQAMLFLNQTAMCSPVALKLSNGTYNTAVFTWPINPRQFPIVIQSASGNPADVVITHSTASALTIDHSSNVTIQDLTFIANNYASVITIGEETDSIWLKNNIVRFDAGNSSQSLIKATKVKGNLFIENNKFIGGLKGLSVTTSTHADGKILIRGNTYVNQIQSGIYVESHRKTDILQNRISHTAPASIYRGMELYAYRQSTTTIANNFIDLEGKSFDTQFWGIWFNNGKANIYFNTFWGHGSGEFNGIVLSGFSSAEVKNNNIVNDTQGPLIWTSSLANYQSDYNNFFTKGPLVRNPDNNNVISLESWQSLYGFDIHSMTINPEMVSGDKALSLNQTNYALNGVGTPIPGITTDIDNEVRDNIKPDIGADEITVPEKDLSISELGSASGVMCAGNSSISVTVKNYGQQAVNGFTIKWWLDGVNQVNYNSSLTLTPNESKRVSIGMKPLLHGQYELKAIVESVGDAVMRNDSTSSTISVGGMSGIYTIGGTNPDFATITAAQDSLQVHGACGPITFNIRPGIYEEGVALSSVLGVSAENSITFQSESQDKNSVTLPGVQLSYTQYINVKHITLANPLPYGIVVGITNSNHTSITHCKIVALNATQVLKVKTYDNLYNPSGFNSFCQNIVDIQKTISLEPTTLFEWSGTVRFDQGNVMDGNVLTIQDPESTTIKISYQSGFMFRNNTISGNLTTGASLISCLSNYAITGNKITASGVGIMVSDNHPNQTEQVGLISNNMVKAPFGLYMDGADNCQIIHNTIVSNGPYYAAALLMNENTGNNLNYDNITIKNNIIVSLNDALCISYHRLNQIQSDYNILYGASSQPFKWISTYQTPSITTESLYYWQKKTQLDQHSLSLLPRFTSATDFHILNDSRISNLGTPLNLSNDVDGDPRNAETPDIGADEFTLTPSSLDIGLSSVIRPDQCGMIKPIQVKIKNYGTTLVTSAIINWSVNGTQMPAYQWSGALTYGSESGAITLGNLNLAKDIELVISTSQPNLGVDQDNINDSQTVRDIFQKLTGTFSIGGSGADFLTITDATKYIERSGVCGPVTFMINPGVYAEIVEVGNIEGASETNRITFQAASADSTSVKIKTSSTGLPNGYYVWLLNGAQFVTLKHLTFHNTWAYYSAVRVLNNTIGVEILNCFFQGGTTSNVSYDVNEDYLTLLTFGKGNHNNVRVESNHFQSGAYAILTTTEGVVVNGSIKNNNLINQYIYGIGMVGPSENLQIRGNTIKAINIPTNGNSAALSVRSSGKGLLIANNKIVGAYYHGIRIMLSGNATSPGVVFNNLVSGESFMASGIYSGSNTNMHYYFNSVRIVSPHGYEGAFYSRFDLGLVFKNNNLTNFGNGNIIRFENLHKPTAQIDYNNFYSIRNIFILENQTFNSFAQYKSVTGFDAHSISANPYYVSDVDLHTQNTALAVGMPIAEILVDGDGNPRDSQYPSIGAYEVKPFMSDAGVLQFNVDRCPDNNDVFVAIKNYGSQSLTSAQINWSVNGQMQPAFQWNGSVASKDTSVFVKIGTYNFFHLVKADLLFWTSMPNGIEEDIKNNDSLRANAVAFKLKGSYTIGGNTSDFSSFNNAVTALAEGICGPVLFQVRDGSYSEEILVPTISGVSAQDTIVFQSESNDRTKVLLRNPVNSTGPVLKFKESSYVTVKNMTISSDVSSLSVIMAEGPALHLNLLGNRIIAPSSGYGIDLISPIINSRIENNLIESGQYGILWAPSLVTDTRKNSNNKIINNELKEQSSTAVTGWFWENVDFSQNTITRVSPIFTAIYLSNSSAVSIQKNKISVAGNGGFITICDQISIVNNFITILEIADHSSALTGLVLNKTRNNQVYFNSILVKHPGNLSSAIKISEKHTAGQLNQIDIKNNIMATSGNGLAFWGTGTGISSADFSLDYNNLYTSGEKLMSLSGSSTESTFSTLSAWITTTSQDTHSINVDPRFPEAEDLHWPALAHVQTGMAISGITTDIDSDLRDGQHPTIGADEVIAPSKPIIILENGFLVSTSADSYQWYLDDVALPKETQQQILPRASGVYKVSGFYGVYEVLSDGYLLEVTGLENDPNIGVLAYPNPTFDFIYVRIIDLIDVSKIQLYNMLGQLQPVSYGLESDLLAIDMSGLPAGFYNLMLLSKNKNHKIRVIKL